MSTVGSSYGAVREGRALFPASISPQRMEHNDLGWPAVVRRLLDGFVLAGGFE
jgi:hypothetical protein